MSATDRLFELLKEFSELLVDLGPRLRTKPIFSPAFSFGKYSIASLSTVEGGLDVVTYYVIHTESRYVLAASHSKGEALSSGRSLLCECKERIGLAINEHIEAMKAKRERVVREWEEGKAARLASYQEDQAASRIRSIPKRRKAIFDKSEGKCHYCGTALTLDGRWHIEHKMPRALMGDDSPGNLVAACVTCNHEKRDKTDLEYLAKRAARKSA